MQDSSRPEINKLLSTRSDVSPVPPTLIPQFVDETTLGQIFQVATVTLVAYDIFLTLDKEVKYFWKLPRKPVDFIFFINRYCALFGAVAGIIGQFTQWSQDVANWLSVVLIDYILVLRVLALFSNDTKLSVILFVLLFLEAIFKLGLILFIDILERPVIGVFGHGLSVCALDRFLPWQWGIADWTIPMVFGIILMILALYKAAEYWKLSNGFKGFFLVKILIEDQILYFLLVIFCCMFNLLQFRILLSNQFLAGLLGSCGNPSFLSVLGSRLLFNMKEAAERGQNEGTSYHGSAGTLGTMEFVEPAIQQESRVDGTEDGGRMEHGLELASPKPPSRIPKRVRDAASTRGKVSRKDSVLNTEENVEGRIALRSGVGTGETMLSTPVTK